MCDRDRVPDDRLRRDKYCDTRAVIRFFIYSYDTSYCIISARPGFRRGRRKNDIMITRSRRAERKAIRKTKDGGKRRLRRANARAYIKTDPVFMFAQLRRSEKRRNQIFRQKPIDKSLRRRRPDIPFNHRGAFIFNESNLITTVSAVLYGKSNAMCTRT